MSGCEFWETPEGIPLERACGLPVVERLVCFNERCGGPGMFRVCAGHLRAHLRQHLFL